MYAIMLKAAMDINEARRWFGLGDDEDIDVEKLKKLKRKLQFEHHPDKGGSEEASKKINDAFDTLRDYKPGSSRPSGGSSRPSGGGFDWDDFWKKKKKSSPGGGSSQGRSSSGGGTYTGGGKKDYSDANQRTRDWYDTHGRTWGQKDKTKGSKKDTYTRARERQKRWDKEYSGGGSTGGGGGSTGGGGPSASDYDSAVAGTLGLGTLGLISAGGTQSKNKVVRNASIGSLGGGALGALAGMMQAGSNKQRGVKAYNTMLGNAAAGYMLGGAAGGIHGYATQDPRRRR